MRPVLLSFFNALNYTPRLIAFSSMGRKDSLTNAEATGEFVWGTSSRVRSPSG